MRACIVLIAITVAAQAEAAAFIEQSDGEWELFKHEHQKNYSSPLEEMMRKQIFMETKKRIDKHNEDFHAGRTTYTMKIGRFSDLLPEEFEETHPPMHHINNMFALPKPAEFALPDVYDLPKHVDWRLAGAVTPVKDQKQCGSCWAFSATGSLEGQWFLKSGQLVSLSEQNLIDCTRPNIGCQGGNLPAAFQYAAMMGIDTEDSYPYEHVNSICRYSATNVGVRSRGYWHMKSGDENELMALVATAGPVSVCIDVRPSFHHYAGGVYQENNCSKTKNNHCVLAVGYGTTDDGQDYWLVKNSWNPKHFGENGYIRMARNRDNMCAIATFAYLPFV